MSKIEVETLAGRATAIISTPSSAEAFRLVEDLVLQCAMLAGDPVAERRILDTLIPCHAPDQPRLI